LTYFERQRGFLQFVQSCIRPRGAQRFTNCTLTGARARERCWKLKGGARVGRTRAALRRSQRGRRKGRPLCFVAPQLEVKSNPEYRYCTATPWGGLFLVKHRMCRICVRRDERGNADESCPFPSVTLRNVPHIQQNPALQPNSRNAAPNLLAE